MKKYLTDQENFWATEFGDLYIDRNISANHLASNLHFFSKVFEKIQKPNSLLEFGANVGMNLKAIQLLFPGIKLKGIEINKLAADQLAEVIGKDNVINDTIFNFSTDNKYDVTLIKGVLIHINPNKLQEVYQKLYQYSNKYIMIAEYYNPTPVSIPYRGHLDKLFKRDFAGEFLDKFPDTTLIDYGFVYKRDPSFPQDDITWFLIEKN